MNLRATPLTAALAGMFSAIVWPLLWLRFGASASAGSLEIVLATLLAVALPAHAFVLGLGHRTEPGARGLDTALLVRVASWLLTALVTVGLTSLYRA